MGKPPRPHQEEQVRCEVCLKEVPASEACSHEAEDYVRFFCGLECFNHWRNNAEQADYTRPDAP